MSKNLRLRFLGAAGTVTGSRHLLDADGRLVLLDCGLFQGVKLLRQRNWAQFAVPPAQIEAVVLSHAHLDHSGYLPRLVREGFRGPIYCSEATLDLCRLLLLDSAHLQEADADYMNRHGISKHQPALPLYTVADAQRAIAALRPVAFDTVTDLPAGLRFQLTRAGHILGAAIIELTYAGRKLVFSGDLGRYNDPLMPPPEQVEEADYLVIESTYGNRLHATEDVLDALGEIILRTVKRGGTVVIPSFAVGRAQLLLFHLRRLKQTGRIPQDLPVYLDSPMASSAVDVYLRHAADQRLSPSEARAAYGVAVCVSDVEQSKALDTSPMPKIIVSASGMATGGRVLHHLKRYANDPRNSVVFAGFQAVGTRGAAMLDGARTVKIHGEYVPVRAEVDNLAMLSAHADADEILRWLRGFVKAPKETFIVHGEPAAADALRLRIKDELGWRCHAVEQDETAVLDAAGRSRESTEEGRRKKT
ncbi:MBL fold/beta-CASP domain-containing RNA metallo-hydrolase [Achromobacter marplatensis]|jgi:metallo-beta-lactamase family protein|uniref:MBL fold/beta-CASP domain-containing RNA metallo-hydrolase n=1 Tax=Achromobacter marplatensis TaxID=470868 RepID=A0AA43B1J9_9BURK|nr:MBL fold/beta-CASP domain-containing RNA metallo-hydrolase [Achromobacter marplatensis]EJO32397.1 metallo-beta-lactamase family protein [Achromobacter marplatensis]MDH2052055.1 MBL fold/beta-CASP domain-containing RNA metallo-hydrolase [Achromobacter marplatensis]